MAIQIRAMYEYGGFSYRLAFLLPFDFLTVFSVSLSSGVAEVDEVLITVKLPDTESDC